MVGDHLKLIIKKVVKKSFFALTKFSISLKVPTSYVTKTIAENASFPLSESPEKEKVTHRSKVWLLFPLNCLTQC